MKLTSILVVALLVLPIVCGISYVHEFVAADSALDSGASFDYTTGKADFSTSHPFISFSHRHQMLLLASAISFALAVVVVERKQISEIEKT
jgi:hypothetical protein